MFNAGEYFGAPKTWGVATSKGEKKTPYAWIEFEITHASDGGQWVDADVGSDGEFQRRTVYLFLSAAAWAYSMEKLDSMGCNGDFTSEGLDFSPEIKKSGIALFCGHETYNNKTREKWDISFQGGGAQHDDMPQDVSMALKSKWKTEHGPKPGAAGPVAPPPAPAAAPAAAAAKPPVLDSDGNILPF